MKYFILLFAIVFIDSLQANDGAFYTRGNQLIPINETDISIKKEILEIRRINFNKVEISVYYEFFNPGKTKKLLVGFEAASPNGDVDGTPIKGAHPYIEKFKVLFNDSKLSYKVSIVQDSIYFKNGKMKEKKASQVISSDTFDPNAPDFFYIYHFNAEFKPGLNTIVHTYEYTLSSGVSLFYGLDYVLTAANRWANKQIDNFTLSIDMGEFQEFEIINSFFENKDDWSLRGKSILSNVYDEWNEINIPSTKFYVQSNPIVFKKMNFSPKGELKLIALEPKLEEPWREFNYYKHPIPYSIENSGFYDKASDPFSYQVLINIPKARRGFVFNDETLQKAFVKTDWYIPNSNLIADKIVFTKEEKEWIRSLKHQDK